ncbi:hypothetical protein KXX65_003789 [Aspergillus fumigatus]|nr:hypothetical protein KXX65_003789 [Aspergillus fumigatus]KAH1814527.1 hypothetical protein KXX19_004492 [Aspergillus fumigatus]KAH3111369.1 hypothetical protein KXW41_000641 [Aspergillus fumigatus]KAJ8148805.1 hypothetical protein LV165_008211 [Aspergillus fumigatus]KAJ8150249.1 hypothetical protein LV162_008204 [Aspergillus fumigatus]
MRQLTEQELQTLLAKLAGYTGRSLNNLIVPQSDSEDDRHVFRLQGNRVYYVKKSLADLSTSFPRDTLLSLGTCIGKFTKTGKFRIHITVASLALDVIAPHARYKVWIKDNGIMPYLYGSNVVKAHVGRWSEDIPEHTGVLVYDSNDTPLGFGVTARSTAEIRKLDPTAIAVFRQADIGEYLREEDTLFTTYFQSPQSNGESTSALNKIFDSYRDAPEENPDGIGIEGAMRFLGDIQVQLDEVACLGIAELLKSPSMGEFTREGFVNGWRGVGCDNQQKMIAHAADIRARIPAEPDLFRRVYRYTFPLCRMQGQRNLQFDIAVEQWRLFFTPEHGGIQWNTPTTPWLDWWIEYLEERGKRPVNKDLWEQVEVFLRKTLEDENFGWWSADAAWPGTLDDFVGWVQAKRGKSAEEMEVE